MCKRLGLIAAGAALAIASGTAAAGSDVHFGISIGVPVAPAPVYVAPPPVVYAPAPLNHSAAHGSVVRSSKNVQSVLYEKS